jgi:ankyrin repeat protein/Zn-dependent protease with chaperone function
VSPSPFAVEGVVVAVAAWLLTYLAHSTVALGGAWLLDRRLRRPADRDALWKVALVAALLTSGAPALLGYSPLAGRVRLPASTDGAVGAAATPPRAETAPTKGIAHAPGAAADAAPAAHGTERRPASPISSAAAGGSRSTSASGREPELGRDRATTPTLRHRALLAVLGLWVCVTAVLLLRLVFGHRGLRAQLGDRRALLLGPLPSTLAALAREAGLGRAVRLTVTARCPTPLAIGRDEVCVPERFLHELAPAAQRAALAHEVAHLARRDPLWQLAAATLAALFFAQPLHRLARRRLRETAELLCDDFAAARGGGLDLAQCLLAVSQWLRQSPLPAPRGLLAMAEGGPGLAARVERLLAARSGGSGRAGLRAAAAAAALLAGAAAAPAVVGSGPAGGALDLAGRRLLDSRAGEGSAASSRRPLEVRRAPAGSLDTAWRWAAEQAGARGEREWWVAWSTLGRLAEGQVTLDDSEGAPLSDLQGPAIAGRLGVEAEVVAQGRSPALVLLRLGANRPGPLRVATRSPRVGMRLSGPVYWLGVVPPGESFTTLVAQYHAIAGRRPGSSLVEAIALHDHPPTLDFLADVLRSARSAEERADAAEGMAYWPGDRATTLLHAAASGDPEESVAAEAAETLGTQPPALALSAIREIVWSGVPAHVAAEGVEALGDLPDGAGAELIEEVAMDPTIDESVAAEAAESLGSLPVATALPALGRLIRGGLRTGVAMEAVEALGELPAGAGTELLDEVVATHGHEVVVREAVESLGSLPRELAEPRLRRIAASHPMAGARAEARETLGELEDGAHSWVEDAGGHTDAVLPPLLDAAASGDFAAVHRLLAAGADPDQRAPRLGTPLIQAAAAGHLEIVDRLMAAGADPSLVEASGERVDDLPRTPLGAAARGGHRAVAERLLASGAPVDLAPAGDPTPLMYAAEGAHLATMELLLEHGADVDARIRGDGTPLIAAVRSGRIEAVERLLDAGAEPDLGVELDETPLYRAVEDDRLGIASLLVSRGARPDLRAPAAESPLALALANGNVAMLAVLAPYARFGDAEP